MQILKTWLARAKNSQSLTLGGTAILVGLTSGIGVWLFKLSIELLRGWAFGDFPAVFHFAKWTIVLVPILGGLIVGVLNHLFLGQEKLLGTAGIMESIALSGGRLRYQAAPLKTLIAILSVGTGASVGPEDPSVQIGANFGSFFAQKFRMSDDRIRALVAAGSAAAIAAAFESPIAGVFFALEIILGQISGGSLGIILVAAVTSSVFTQAVSGASPAFQVPPYPFNSVWELPLYLALGLLAGPVSAIYVRLLYATQDFHHKQNIPPVARPILAGALLGIVGVFLPQVLGSGYETVGEILNKNDFTFWLLFALFIGKLLATPLSLGSGFFGGVIAPSLFIGATLGGAFGMIVQQIFPALGISAPAFALVGMAAVLAGAIRAPLTAVILLFEMTNDYHIILPLMFAVAVSLWVSQRIQSDSIYTMGLARHGIRLDRQRDAEIMQAVTVGEAMQINVHSLLETITVHQAADLLMHTRHHGLPVVDEDGLLSGILTVQDIEYAAKDSFVRDACTRDLETAFPDETLNVALRRMSRRDIGRLPVVARSNSRKLLGVLRRSDVIRAYNIALARRSERRHHDQAIRLDALTAAHVGVTDIVVETGAACDGKQTSEIHFPRDSVIASVRRGEQIFIPRGETKIHAGDVLVVVAEEEALQEVLKLCRAN